MIKKIQLMSLAIKMLCELIKLDQQALSAMATKKGDMSDIKFAKEHIDLTAQGLEIIMDMLKSGK